MSNMASSEKQKPSLSNLPDDDEDLEDLDDVLDQFTTTNQTQLPPPPPPTAAATSTYGRPRTNTRVDAPPKPAPGGLGAGLDSTTEMDEDELSAEFSRELAKGMESLMRDINGGSLPGENQGGSAGGGGVIDDEAARRFKAAWEAMLVDDMDENMAGGSEESNGLSGSSSGGTGSEDIPDNDFQGRVQRAMDRLQETEKRLQAEAKNKSGPDGGVEPADNFNALLAALAEGGEIPGTDDELAGLLENMMGQVLSKDVLYDALKDLVEKFPPYLQSPPAPISEEDRASYENQLRCMRQVVVIYERPSYSDDDANARAEISDLMTEMQNYGTPPPELLGPEMADQQCVIA